MKTIKVSDETHQKLTEILGKLIAETGKMQTYEDVINTLIAVYNVGKRSTSNNA